MNPTPQLDSRIARKLAGLRMALRLRLIGRGLAWVVVTLIGAALVTLVVDYGLHRLTLQHMTVAQRLPIVLLCLAGIGWVTWRRLIRSLLWQFSDEELAMMVERSHPELADRLISSLQFQRDPRGASPELLAKVAEQANALAVPMRFHDVLRVGEPWRHLGLAAGVVLVAVLLAVWQPALAQSWCRRIVLLGNARYPQRTELTILGDHKLRVARGSPLDVRVQADPRRYVPDEVVFHMTYGSLGNVEETVSLATDSADTYVKRFEAVGEPFRFHVTGSDARTDDVVVEVAEPPTLRDINFTVDRPAYMRLPTLQVTGAKGTLELPEQSWITARALATKDLAEAQVLVDGQPAGDCRIIGNRQIEARFMVKAPEPYRANLTLRFALRDSEGFSNPSGAQYHILLVPDKPPAVQLVARGVGGQISARAMIPLEITARDDYGVSNMSLEWTVLSAAEKSHLVPVTTFDPDVKEPPPFRHVIDLEKLVNEGPTNQPAVNLGESIRFMALVHDALPAPKGPNSAASNLITLKVVADGELLGTLVDAQRVMRDQFRQVILIQTEAKEKTEASLRQAGAPAAPGGTRQLLVEAGDLQQQVNDRVDNVADRFEVILEQIRNNRLGAEADENRLQTSIIAPLRQLSQGALKSLAYDLVGLRDQTDPAVLTQGSKRVADNQAIVLNQMEQVLNAMIKVENAQQVERGLRAIIEMSEQVRAFTRSRKTAEPESPQP